MKRTMFQRVLCLVLSATVLLGMFGISASAASLKDVDVQAPLADMDAFLNASSYAEYYAKYHPSDDPDQYMPVGADAISIDVKNFQSGSTAQLVKDSEACQTSYYENPENWEYFGDINTVGADAVYLPATDATGKIGQVKWNFTVMTAGLYYIRIEFFDCNTAESSVSSIERKLQIDDNVPFTEASYIELNKNWGYGNAKTYTLDEYASYYKQKYGKDLPELQNGISTEVIDNKENGAYLSYHVYEENGVRMVKVSTIVQDINGNSMTPDIVQIPKWNTYTCSDSTGYTQGDFQFYFSASASAGEPHTITLQAEREPVIIKSITLVPVTAEVTEVKSYADVKAEYATKGYTTAGGAMTVIQAEFPDFVSDASVSVTNDNTSCATYPSVAKAQLFNVIGENSYSSVGQWAAYRFTVSETGLYKFGMRYLQNALQGMFVCRAIKLSGGQYGLPDGTPTLPFAEANNARFSFSDDWQSSFVGDENEVFEFYFEKGVEYTVYFECSLGSLRELLSEAEAALENVNSLYLRILQLTGSDPDEYKNYQFEELMPDVLITLLDEAARLCRIADAFVELSDGDIGSHVAILDNVARLLDRMGSDGGYEIARNLSNLKSNLGTLGSWINDSKSSSMIVDAIYIAPADAQEKSLPRADAGFFQSLWFEIKAFFCSFFTDYEAMGLTKVPSEGAETIDVWLASGRDQSNIWRNMIDLEGEGGFTNNTGIAVTLKLITAGTLLPSILAGKGPDVYLGLGSADVINYAIRDAVLGISGNDPRLNEANDKGVADNSYFTSYYYTYYNEDTGEFERTTTPDPNRTPTFVSQPYSEAVPVYDPVTGTGNYAKAALDTITLRNVAYGLPMTMSFSMLFYRADILAGLGEQIPETWSDLLALLPELQANNMSVGVTYSSAYIFMLYQKGGNMWRYTDDPTGEYAGARIGLDTNVAYETFDYVCKLYTDYSFPVTFDAANRFRTGEMPLLIGEYTTVYNQLVVFATEINGLWNFCSVPGTVNEAEDGTKTFNYDSLAGVTATVMLYSCDNKLAAWEFIQWQGDAERQADYGNKMVALIGPSAKYESANIQALRNLSWSASELASISDQINHLSSVVNYPGSYIIDRYIRFAFLDAYNDGAKPVDAIRGYIDAINTEVARKREEFEMKTLTANETPDYLK